MEKRVLKLRDILFQSIDQFIQECRVHFHGIIGIDIDRMNRINHENLHQLLSIDNILNQCKNKLTQSLLNWNGVKKSKKDRSTFRAYFKIARNTFDQQKITIIAGYLWIPMIKKISEVQFKSIVCLVVYLCFICPLCPLYPKTDKLYNNYNQIYIVYRYLCQTVFLIEIIPIAI